MAQRFRRCQPYQDQGLQTRSELGAFDAGLTGPAPPPSPSSCREFSEPFWNEISALPLGINLCTRNFAEARLYCAGTVGILARKGSAVIDVGGGVRARIRTRRKCMK